MIDKLMAFSIKNKLIIVLFVLALIAWGSYSMKKIPIDAVPDITNNQVQILTQSPTLAAQEVEQFITFPLEIAMSNLPDVVEIRSISRFGLSVITVVFEEEVNIYLARQLISEQLKTAENDIPEGFGKPELAPITTGLGEVYQYILHTTPEYDSVYSDMDLRSINDWLVKRQLAGTKGVIEVSSWGGHLKQYEVAVNPEKLNSLNLTIAEVFAALESNNENTGGSYIEKQHNAYFIRGEGLVKSVSDIEKIVVKTANNIPVLIRDVAVVQFGSATRFGAVTWNGKGEAVAGQALMLKGENSYSVVEAVKERIEQIKKSLPEGVMIEPYIDRSELIGRAIGTVSKNLIEGGLIVIFILVLLLGNFRGGLIVASVIPLSMLFALCMMNMFGISANLMSLGAIDFGLIVDGAVIIVESIVHRLFVLHNNKTLTVKQMDAHVHESSVKIRSSAAFGEIIILIVYLPILALVGIEGKMFGPMAQTVSFAILGALILSLTYVPMMCALFLKKEVRKSISIADKIIDKLQKVYSPVLQFSLKNRMVVLIVVLILFGAGLFTFSRLGGEFIPTLDEGDFALHQILPPGSSLSQSVEVSGQIQKVLLDNFPEIDKVVTKMGTAEIPTDPMPLEVGDIMVKMKPRSEWRYQNREDMFEAMEASLSVIAGVNFEFTQPIQMRFNELISGVREDIAVKIYGENLDVLFQKGKEAEKIIANIEGSGDVKVEQIVGLPQIVVRYDRNKIAKHGLNIKKVNDLLRSAFAGKKAGIVIEAEKRFDLVVRLQDKFRHDIASVRNLYLSLPSGSQIPLDEVAYIGYEEAPMQISREDTKRRITIGVNARNRDIESLVGEIREKLDTQLNLPAGYFIEYGGQFENLVEAKSRLLVAVPAALMLILLLLFFTFGSFKQALLIFTAIPLSAIGGIYALWLRDMPFSISAGIGFIALFGVAVLNGIVLIGYFNQLKQEGMTNLYDRIMEGTKVRLRPVLMTASVAALGFLPMALSSTAGGEVQKPLATVVIGGLITATILTLVILPILYSFLENFKLKQSKKALTLALIFTAALGQQGFAQTKTIGMDEAVELAFQNHPSMKIAALEIEKQQQLEKATFNPGKTSISYGRGEFNAKTGDSQWQVSQDIRFPSVYSSQKKLEKSKTNLSEEFLNISKNELERQVRTKYVELLYAFEGLRLLNELQTGYSEFAAIAKRRYDVGETNLLELTVAESKVQKVTLEQQQSEATINALQNDLKILLNSDVPLMVDTTETIKLGLEFEGNNSTVANPMVQYYRQAITVAENNYRLKKADRMPDFSIGYLNQEIFHQGGHQAIKAGIKIPVFDRSNKGKINAAKLEVQISQSRLEQTQLELESELNQKMLAYHKKRLLVDYYETTGSELSSRMMDFSKKSYKNGEIGYVEYISGLDQAVALKQEYIASLSDYNLLVIDIKNLLGAYN
ncbi:CusA/CzcA family heavy metal efflux RND transporter [Reichenbachiella sp. MALMAid0571]|uniref:CusA/CzcA family heavy metal efflux RND transporter n=1 Tax=Reichenbachiella sp. MALMAid0571 TaxID=3143939 RepID=UPI0032DFE09F